MSEKISTTELPQENKDASSEPEFVEDFKRDIEMYNMSGHPPLTEDDITRYYTSNEKLRESLSRIIRQAFRDKNRPAFYRAASIIQYAPEEEQESLRTEVSSFIKEKLENEDSYIRGRAIDMIQHAPESSRTDFIKQGLEDEDSIVRQHAVAVIRYAPEQDRAGLIQKAQQGIEGRDPYIRRNVAFMIQYAPEQDRAGLIQQAFEDEDLQIRREAVHMIQYASEQDRTGLIQQALESRDFYICSEAADMIEYAPEVERAELIKQALEGSGLNVHMHAAEMIEYAPKEEQESLRAKVTPLIKQKLENEDPLIRRKATAMIRYAPEQDRTGLIQQAFEDKDERVRKEAEDVIEYAPEEEGTELNKLIPGQDEDSSTSAPEDPEGLEELATQTPLYQEDSEFVREEFLKSGSGTTLLDKVPGREGTLKERVIIRHINVGPYLEWRKAFEAHEFWRKKGFDYVPIEPIVGVREPKDNFKVDVFSRVIPGPSIAMWSKKGGPFLQEIQEQADKIREGLVELGIQHGHPHERNFVVHFFRKENGKPDLSRPPRVYAIDFDAASSPG